jgi:hypothetical protein
VFDGVPAPSLRHLLIVVGVGCAIESDASVLSAGFAGDRRARHRRRPGRDQY